MAIYHFTQAGAGSFSGADEANAIAIANITTSGLGAGDIGYIHGTITSGIALGALVFGASNNPVILDGAEVGGTPAYLNPGVSTDAITFSPNISNLTIKNFKIGTCKRGIYSFTHWHTHTDILISNIEIENADWSGILWDVAQITFAQAYPILSNVVISNCVVHTAGNHGISLGGKTDNSCRISNCIVYEAATGGNYWGLYMSSRNYNGTKTWTGTNPYTTDIVTDWGMDNNEIVEQLLVRDYDPVKFTKGTYGALNVNEYAQSGTTLQINMAVSPNTYEFYLTPYAGIGGIIEDCAVYNVSNNSGTTDGVGIGFDIGKANGTIRRCYAENNEGRGMELALTTNCTIENCISNNNGLWGFDIYSSDNAKVYNCISDNSTSHAFYAQKNTTGGVEFKNNIALNAGGFDYSYSVTTGHILENNMSWNCTSTPDRMGIQADPLLLDNYSPGSTSPCLNAGVPPLSNYDAYSKPNYGNHIGAVWPEINTSKTRRSF